MTDRPTNGPFTSAQETGPRFGAIRISKDNKLIARFIGPDREANAKLFLRAQHMDELVEAATDALHTLERTGGVPFRNGVTDQNGQGDEGEYWFGVTFDNLRVTLAKIQEEK
jgi:hypothetical protein